MKLLRNFVVFIFVTVADAVHTEDWRIIRDAEIEEILTEITKSIFEVAGLRPESAKVYVVDSDVVNAFTIGNGYIFINSGLLLQCENPLQLVGILCHETGHIAAGHINRLISVLRKRSENLILAMLAGILGSAITGSEKALALALGYSATDEGFFLRFSRGEELAADSMAVNYLEKLGYGAEVMIKALEMLQRIDTLNGDANLPTYIRTHPKTKDRISYLIRLAKGKKCEADAWLSEKYNRVLNKLKAYLKGPGSRQFVPEDDYSKAIYLHKSGKSEEAICILHKISKTKEDIYYKETLAQVLYEYGKLKESIKIYKEIYNKDINVLIKIDYANVLIEANENIDLAISILEAAKYSDYINSDIFRLLAKGYGKQGKNGLSFLMLAQEQILLQNYYTAYKLLTRSLQELDVKTEKSNIKKAKYLKELLKRNYEEHLSTRSFGVV